MMQLRLKMFKTLVVMVRPAVEDNMVDTPNCPNLHLDKILCPALNFYRADGVVAFGVEH